jgi:hypothetical protein
MLMKIIKKTALFLGAVINVLGSLAAVFIFVFPGVHDTTLILCLLNADKLNIRQDPNHFEKRDHQQGICSGSLRPSIYKAFFPFLTSELVNKTNVEL